MIVRPPNKDKVLNEYIVQGFCRLYASSINENGEYGDFFRLCEASTVDKKGRIMIPYEDYYCSADTYNKIVDTLCDEPYILINGKAKRYLKLYEKQSVKMSLALGCSPSTAKENFLKKHPKFKKYYSLVD